VFPQNCSSPCLPHLLVWCKVCDDGIPVLVEHTLSGTHGLRAQHNNNNNNTSTQQLITAQ